MAYKPTANASKLPIDDAAATHCATTAEPTNRDAMVLPASGYLTAEWVRRRYSISNSTLYKWIADKRFPAPTRIGPRAVRWRAEHLAVFEASFKAGE